MKSKNSNMGVAAIAIGGVLLGLLCGFGIRDVVASSRGSQSSVTMSSDLCGCGADGPCSGSCGADSDCGPVVTSDGKEVCASPVDTSDDLCGCGASGPCSGSCGSDSNCGVVQTDNGATCAVDTGMACGSDSSCGCGGGKGCKNGDCTCNNGEECNGACGASCGGCECVEVTPFSESSASKLTTSVSSSGCGDDSGACSCGADAACGNSCGGSDC